MFLRVLIAVALCACSSGCLDFRSKLERQSARPTIMSFPKNDATGEPRLVGKVSMVNSAGKFVLLDCDAWSAPSAGTAVKCFRYGAETAILNVGSERRSSTVVADIVKGEPQRGDEVFQ